MSDYTKTNKVGTSRLRAFQTIINTPANKAPSVTFWQERRVILVDGKELFVPEGLMTININEESLSRVYPRTNIETGAVIEGQSHTGAEILATVQSLLGDLFIGEGRRLAAVPKTLEE